MNLKVQPWVNLLGWVLALKRAGWVSTFRTVYSILLKTSRVYCSKRQYQTGYFQSHTHPKRFTHVVPASLLFIYSFFLFLHIMQSFKQYIVRPIPKTDWIVKYTNNDDTRATRTMENECMGEQASTRRQFGKETRKIPNKRTKTILCGASLRKMILGTKHYWLHLKINVSIKSYLVLTRNWELLIVYNIVRNGSLWGNAVFEEKKVIFHTNIKRT